MSNVLNISNTHNQLFTNQPLGKVIDNIGAQWIGQGAAQKQADILMKRLKGKPGIGKVENLNA